MNLSHIITLSLFISLSVHCASEEINRKVYVDFVVKEINPQSLVDNPNRGQYGPRHALTALALYNLTGERRYGEAIKQSLKYYDLWMQEEIKANGAHFSWEGSYLCGFHVQALRKGGLLTKDDEEWIREMFIRLADNLSAWRPKDGLWRGSQHRSQGQAIARGLAAMWYPDYEKSNEWKKYFNTVWNDWWEYKDVGINDTGYFYGSLMRILCCAELMDKNEVFTDPDVKRFLWDRLLYEVTPDGAIVPYGAHSGWNSEVGNRIFFLELIASHTKDGRYRWVAHKLMNYLTANGKKLKNQHHIHAVNIESIALASLVCDDSIKPIEPDPSSKVLYRKEVLRLSDEQVSKKYAGYGGLDCNMDMSQKVMPHKVVFRDSWNPGDFYMLIEAFPRHDPLNPTAILGLMRYGSAMTMMESEKFISRENAVKIEDLSGNANFIGKANFQGEKLLPTGYDGMDVTIKAFSDHKLASHVVMDVTNYMGYKAKHEREIFFIKGRFAIVKDLTIFDDSFKCRIGPVWNSQYVEHLPGANWVNTYMTAFYFQGNNIYDNIRRDLLVYHIPKSDRRLEVSQRPELENARLSTQYIWEGNVQPGFSVQFVHILIPHLPDQPADKIVSSIKLINDEPNLVIVKVGDEYIALNNNGADISILSEAGLVSTDAKLLYLKVQNGERKSILATETTYIKADEQYTIKKDKRTTYEKM